MPVSRFGRIKLTTKKTFWKSISILFQEGQLCKCTNYTTKEITANEFISQYNFI